MRETQNWDGDLPDDVLPDDMRIHWPPMPPLYTQSLSPFLPLPGIPEHRQVICQRVHPNVDRMLGIVGYGDTP